ncbi:hypothetical protein LFL97_24675 [Burkholderia sp. JSH-S8]|nr:hypothetical protein LFL97_24675 [Burkholderia sp. JSH-S8]
MDVSKPLRAEALSEVQRLERELKRVTVEHDILKKALGYFAKDPEGSTPGLRGGVAYSRCGSVRAGSAIAAACHFSCRALSLVGTCRSVSEKR